MRVFISYAFDDQNIMEIMKRTSEKYGINSFTAKHDMKYGSSQTKTVQEAIEDSNAVIAIITKDHPSLSVAQEVGFALKSKIPVIPFVEENANVGFMLGDIAHIRFTKFQVEQACEKVSKFILKEIDENDRLESETLVDERKLVNEHAIYGANFDEGDLITGSISSDLPINIYIVDNKNLQLFIDENDFDYELEAEQITRYSLNFEIPKTRTYHILIENINRKPANVDINLSVEPE